MASRKRGAVVVLGATGLTLILLDLVGGQVPDTIRNVGASALSPLQTVSGAIAAPAVGWIEATGNFASGEIRAADWQEQAPAITQVRGDQRTAELDQLLGLLNTADLTVVPGRVVAYPISEPDPETNIATINWIAEKRFDRSGGWRRQDWNRTVAPGDIVADFYDLGAFARQSEDEITIAKNGGGAHLDLMTSRYVLDAWKG